MNSQRSTPRAIDPDPDVLGTPRVDRPGTPGSACNSPQNDQTTASHAIRVLCVEEHEVLVEGLKAYFAINGAIEVVGRLADVAQLVEEIARLHPHAVLLDIAVPAADTFAMAERLRHSHPGIRVMVLTAHVRDAFISASFAAGVCAYFAKSDELNDIACGIHKVMQNRSSAFLLGPKVRERCRTLPIGYEGRAAKAATRTAVRVTRTGAPMTLLDSLTPSEVKLLQLIGEGLNRTQIAAQLDRRVKSIDATQNRLKKKLGIANRADLIRFAIREGLVKV